MLANLENLPQVLVRHDIAEQLHALADEVTVKSDIGVHLKQVVQILLTDVLDSEHILAL